MVENPFCYGEVVEDKFFVDREKEIEELKGEFRSSQNVIIFSPRRYGKTSLIKKVLRDLEKEGLIVVYIDLFWATSHERFIQVYAKAIARAFGGRIKTALSSLKAILPRLIPRIVITSDDRSEFEFSFDPREEKPPIMEDLYEAVHKRALQNKKKAVVVFDEFQEILALKDEGIERQMRSHFQLHRDIAYVFCGSKSHLIQKLFNDRERAFYGSGRFYPLGKIPEASFFEWIGERFASTGIKINKEEVSKILKATTSHPYYTQQLCHFLWERCHFKQEVTSADVKESVKEMILSQTANYTNIWDSLTAGQRNFLIALALTSPANIFARDFLARYNLGIPSNVQRLVSSLREKGILEKENDKVTFGDVFFPIWLRGKAELE
ncbi:MAG: ATP-binding protein [bacterium]|nr:ATP-binding protein [bacterium]